MPRKTNLTAPEALRRLREGNHRFANDLRSLASLATHERRTDLVAGQTPFAVILGCSDSRAPAELIFDQGLGDLFVIRVAGNIVAPSLVGSVEFAAEEFGTRLVVVMGHTHCGAVTATIDALRSGAEPTSRNLLSIVDRVRPAVSPLCDTELAGDRERLVRAAVRANVLSSANHLRHGSQSLETLIADDDLRVVGAEYDLETGVVDFFDGLDAVAELESP